MSPFQWNDPFLLEHQLSSEERAIRDAAAAYCQGKLAPRHFTGNLKSRLRTL